MYNQLAIEDDPTTWYLANTIDAPALASSGPPFVVTTLRPLPATLLVSGRARWVALALAGGEPHGPIPTGVELGSYLYLPTLTGLNAKSPGYALADGANTDSLQSQIVAAMTNGTSLAVPLHDGALVLNGAVVPFAAIFTVARQAT